MDRDDDVVERMAPVRIRYPCRSDGTKLNGGKTTESVHRLATYSTVSIVKYKSEY